MSGLRPGSSRLLALLLGLALAAVAFQLARGLRETARLDVHAALRDPAVRDEVMAELIEASPGIWDSFPDPDVGRVLQAAPALDLDARPPGNRLGLRERDYALPKPPGVQRVVLLGDSYVFGNGVAAADRLGVRLAEYLRLRAGNAEAAIECLHVGVGGWNVRAECAYLRRQLSLLEPDLVVQVLFSNDLDDTGAVRGFGAMARSSTQRPGLTDSLFAASHPFELGFTGFNLLTAGLDFESRTRYAEARAELERLARAVEASGARYLVVLQWPLHAAVAARSLLGDFREDQLGYLPASFFNDPEYRISRVDSHWSPAGHARVALFLYGLIQQRGLLPELELSPWPAASAAVEELHGAWHREAAAEHSTPRVLAPADVGRELDLDRLTESTARQVHGGIDGEGLVAPYAAVVLRCAGARTLVLTGHCLERPELDGTRVAVSVDEVEVGSFRLRSGEPIQLELELPTDELRRREFVSVRLASDDYVYIGDALRHCVVFRLGSLRLDP